MRALSRITRRGLRQKRPHTSPLTTVASVLRIPQEHPLLPLDHPEGLRRGNAGAPRTLTARTRSELGLVLGSATIRRSMTVLGCIGNGLPQPRIRCTGLHDVARRRIFQGLSAEENQRVGVANHHRSPSARGGALLDVAHELEAHRGQQPVGKVGIRVVPHIENSPFYPMLAQRGIPVITSR
jgi:hypothetical protein